MDRRDLLLASSTMTAPTGATAAPDAAGPGAMAVPQPVASPRIAPGARAFVLAVPASLAGIEVTTAAYRLAAELQQALGDDTAVRVVETAETGHAAVTGGSADFYLGLEAQHAHVDPAFHAFCGLPIGADLPPNLHQAWMTAGPGLELLEQVAAGAGMVVLPAFHTGRSNGLMSDRLIETVADLRGLTIACHGLACEMVRRVGAAPASYAEPGRPGDDAGREPDASEPLVPAALPFAHWTYAPGLTPGGFLLTLGLKADAWHRLAPSAQAILRGVAASSFARSQAEAEMRELALADIAAYRRRPVHTTLPVALRGALAAATCEIVDDLAARTPLAGRVFSSLRALHRSAARDHWAISPETS